jgi:hypothetical protein
MIIISDLPLEEEGHPPATTCLKMPSSNYFLLAI